jgi:type I restriction-modification system DNA methylase subunit
MADERQKLFPERSALIPRALDWQSRERLDGDDLDAHYRHILVELGKKPGMLGTIFRKAQNRIQDPAKLKRLISDLIGRETWTTLGVDVKGDAYEGLLEKNAADVKGGAGQYFTPRALIQAIVDVMRPEPGKIALYFTGGRHAGENLAEVLKQRSVELPSPIQMCDALSRNVPKLPAGVEILLANCPRGWRRS